MGVFDKIAGVFEGIFETVTHPVQAFEWLWNGVKWIWWFLSTVASLVTSAWDWMVNGVQWFTDEVSHWAGEAFEALRHIIVDVIPNALGWLGRTLWNAVTHAFLKAWRFVESTASHIYGWAARELGKLAHTIKVAVSEAIKWVENAVHFVAHWGGWILHLLTHPDNIVKWILGALIDPLVMWILRSGSNVIVWALRKAASEGSEVAHLVESVLADML
jgi:phage-related protein